jgi:hypothetical protein
MLKDMLQPPRDGNDEFDAQADETKAAAGRAMASIDEAMEPIEASEERNAAMESESIKGPSDITASNSDAYFLAPRYGGRLRRVPHGCGAQIFTLERVSSVLVTIGLHDVAVEHAGAKHAADRTG